MKYEPTRLSKNDLKIHLGKGNVARVEMEDSHGGVVDVDVVHVERLHHVTRLTDGQSAVRGEEVHHLLVAGAPHDGVHLLPFL